MAPKTPARRLGLSEVLFISVGFIIGGGVFVFTGIVSKICGTALPLAYAIAVVPVFMGMLPVAMLGSALPTNGGNYKYPSRMFSPGLAFVGAWTYAFCSFFGLMPLLAKGCTLYLQSVFPSLPALPTALALITIFYLINLLGIKTATLLQGLLVLFQVSALLGFGVSGTVQGNLPDLQNMLANGTGPILLGAALLTFTYSGANAIIELGHDIRDPGRTIPRAFLISFLAVATIYTLAALATVGSGEIARLKASEEPLIMAVETVFAGFGRTFFILGGAVVALTTTLNAMYITCVKSLLVIIEDGLLPRRLGRINQRFNSPHEALTFLWVISMIGVVSGLPADVLAAYSSLGALAVLIPTQIVAIGFPRSYPEHYAASPFKLKGRWQTICPVVGILVSLFFGGLILIDLGSVLKIGGFVFFVCSGILYYRWRKTRLNAGGHSRAIRDEWPPALQTQTKGVIEKVDYR